MHFPATFRSLTAHRAHTKTATITKPPSGTWRVQVRRKGKPASETVLRRDDGEAWAWAVELKIARGGPILRDAAKTFDGLIDLHKGDLARVGKSLCRVDEKGPGARCSCFKPVSAMETGLA